MSAREKKISKKKLRNILCVISLKSQVGVFPSFVFPTYQNSFTKSTTSNVQIEIIQVKVIHESTTSIV